MAGSMGAVWGIAVPPPVPFALLLPVPVSAVPVRAPVSMMLPDVTLPVRIPVGFAPPPVSLRRRVEGDSPLTALGGCVRIFCRWSSCGGSGHRQRGRFALSRLLIVVVVVRTVRDEA